MTAPGGPSASPAGPVARPLRIGLFIACFNDALYPQTGRALVRLLGRLGHQIEFPAAQTCCGQMHYNTGYVDACVPLARNFADTFGEYDVVLAASGSCAAMVRDYYPVVAKRSGDRGLARDVERVMPRVHELSELLIDVLGVTDVGAYFPHRVTYHPTCHTMRMLKVGDKPLQLLRAVNGIDLVELGDATECCGFGGTFAMRNRDVSGARGTDKAGHVLASGAEVLACADNSCLMHIGGLLAKGHSGVRPLHYAEILAATHEHPLDTGTPLKDVQPPVTTARKEAGT